VIVEKLYIESAQSTDSQLEVIRMEAMLFLRLHVSEI
jgi:hypothetical protein